MLPEVPFSACLDAFLADTPLEGYVGETVTRTRLLTFPDLLVVQLKRFTYGEHWTPMKICANVQVPEEVEFAAMRARPLEDGEVLAEVQQAGVQPGVEAAGGQPATPPVDQGSRNFERFFGVFLI